jgi:hypothetical protein
MQLAVKRRMHAAYTIVSFTGIRPRGRLSSIGIKTETSLEIPGAVCATEFTSLSSGLTIFEIAKSIASVYAGITHFHTQNFIYTGVSER